ncbi:MAG: phosphatase domain-containing protein [Rhizobacter sp.]
MKRFVACAALALALSAAHAAEPLHDIVDDGWATAQGYRLTGRLTRVHAVPSAGSSAGSSLYGNSRLLLTNGAEGRVQIAVGAATWQTRADEHGYWELQSNQPLADGVLAPGWHEITSTPIASTPAHWLVHDPRNQLGVISDIDDTILITDVNHTGQLLRNSLAVPPDERKAVPRMAALYHAWAKKNANPEATPVFYVSASPRQLSDGTRRFLKRNGFPQGVLQLKEVSSQSRDPLTDQQGYKVRRITAVLKAFPDVRFVLFGDDGERDPESYAQVSALFPNQIVGVWIRRVNPDPARARIAGQQDTDELLRTGWPP